MRAARGLAFLLAVLFPAFLSGAIFQSQIAHWWEPPVESLTSKIAESLRPQAKISLTVKNISSLEASSVVEIRGAVEERLGRRGFSISPPATGITPIEVTLSENLRSFVWAARIRPGAEEKVVIVTEPRTSAAYEAWLNPKPSLQRQMVTVESERILDFAVIHPESGDESIVVVLGPDQLVFRWPPGIDSTMTRAVPLPHAIPGSRDVRGVIDLQSNAAFLPGVECAGNFAQPNTVHCSQVSSSEDQASVAVRLVGLSVAIEGHDVEAVALRGVCGYDSLTLASGASDWTQPDEIRAYTLGDQKFTAASKPIEYSGPILVMWPSSDGKSARVISRNLQTGMYEASIVTLSCTR